MITRENYEAYFLDHSEGNLSPEEQAELFSFLKQNPDLENELQQFSNAPIPAERLVFEHKAKLKKLDIQATILINEHNYNEFFIAWYEGDLDVSGKEEVELFLKKNPSLIRDFKLFAKARLQPEKIVFRKKQDLKRNKIVPLYRSISWVALAAAAFTAAFFIFKESPEQQPLYVEPIVQADIQPVEAQKPTVIHHENIPLKVVEIAKVEQVIPIQEKTRNTESIISMPIRGARELVYVSNFLEIEAPKLNTALFEDILLRYSIEELEEQKKASLLNKTIHAIASLSPWSKGSKQEEKRPISFWDIADYGVKGINELTASNLELKHSRNPEGKLESFSFGNDNFKIAKAAPSQ